MAGVTDRPFRSLCKRLGAGMAVSEMVASNSLLWGSEKTIRRGNHDGEVEPKVIQIAGADPEMMAEAAKYNVDSGAHIIDINMGCPAKKICNVYAGSALLKDEPLVARIVDAVVRAVNVPVTLKIRTGWNTENRNALRIAKIAEDHGIQSLAMHGRTRACMYTGDAEYDTIRDICAEAAIPVIANGDIDSAEKACSVLDFTHATAVMIGRAAHGSPWIFREVNSFLESGKKSAPLLRTQIRDIILEHITALYAFHGEASGVRIARKHLGWYCQQHTDTKDFRSQLMAAESSSVQFAVTAACFGEWSDNENNSLVQERANAGNDSERRQDRLDQEDQQPRRH